MQHCYFIRTKWFLQSQSQRWKTTKCICLCLRSKKCWLSLCAHQWVDILTPLVIARGYSYICNTWSAHTCIGVQSIHEKTEYIGQLPTVHTVRTHSASHVQLSWQWAVPPSQRTELDCQTIFSLSFTLVFPFTVLCLCVCVCRRRSGFLPKMSILLCALLAPSTLLSNSLTRWLTKRPTNMAYAPTSFSAQLIWKAYSSTHDWYPANADAGVAFVITVVVVVGILFIVICFSASTSVRSCRISARYVWFKVVVVVVVVVKIGVI